MKNLTATICLTLAVLLGSAGVSWSQDFLKGLAAYARGDYATALREWTPFAEQGDANAQYKLGAMYDKGLGVPQDYKTAVKWYTLAAEQGYAKAQYNLDLMYDKGLGVPQDFKTALKWHRRAAEQGKASAQKKLKKIKTRLVSKGIDECLYKEVAKITGPESKKIVEKYCRKKLEKKSLDWLLRYAD
jgi:hypothetical protein